MSIFPTTLQDKTLIHSSETRQANEEFNVERTDNQLVGLVLDGDETAFESLFERHKRLVAVIAARYFRQPQQIEEIIQISFAKAYIELRKFRGDHDLSLANWLVRITSNTCLDQLRLQKRRPETFLADADQFGQIADTASESKNSEELLIDRDLAEKLLSALPPEDRSLLQMLNIEELSIAETAAMMNWSVSKTKIRAWRARKDLRRIIKKFL